MKRIKQKIVGSKRPSTKLKFFMGMIGTIILIITLLTMEKKTHGHIVQEQARISYGTTVPNVLLKKEHLTTQQMARLYDLTATHPDERIRNDLFPLLKNGTIRVEWTGDANFGKFIVREVREEERGIVQIPVLAINRDVLLHAQTNVLHLVIFHEYIHYRQWKQKRFSADQFIHRQIKSVEQQEAWCEQKWYAEMEAYHEECSVAGKIGALSVLDFCTKEGAINLTAFRLMMHQEDPSITLCIKTWIDLS